MALVESVAKHAEAACHHISKYWDIPLILMVKDSKIEWNALHSISTDGYLSKELGKGEFRARLRAIVRRFYKNGRVEKVSP